jgi:anti-sigma B factor antagonist
MTTRPPPHPTCTPLGDGLTLHVVGDAPVVRVLVVGELDSRTAPRLTRCLRDLLDSGRRRIDLDLSGTTFVAAAGLTAFREAALRAEQVAGGVRLTAVPSRVRRILAITALDTVIEVQVTAGASAEPASSA